MRQCRTEQFRPEGLCMLWHTHVLALARNWPITLFGDFTVEAGNTAEAEAAARMAVRTLLTHTAMHKVANRNTKSFAATENAP